MPTALIVGASRGLGRGLAQELIGRGWQVIATVRQADALADLASDSLTVETLDTTDWTGVAALASKLQSGSLDLLFVNAGIMGPSGNIGAVPQDGFAELMLVNALAPLHIVEALAGLVAPEGTIAVMSSIMGSIALNDGGYGDAYRMSKAALNQGFAGLSKRTSDKRTWLAIHPGWVRTEMGGAGADITIDESVAGIANVIESHTGGDLAFVNYKDESLPW